MSAAPEKFPNHETRNVVYGDASPRAARKLPNATAASAGNGGKMFSTADMTPIATYSVPSGSPLNHPMTASTLTPHPHPGRSRQLQLQYKPALHHCRSSPCLRWSSL